MQLRLRRSDRDLEQVTDLVMLVSLNVVQHEDLARPIGQLEERRVEVHRDVPGTTGQRRQRLENLFAVQVTLATGLAREECEAVNLGYRDPASIRTEDWAGREAESVLLVPHAGEVLYRVRG